MQKFATKEWKNGTPSKVQTAVKYYVNRVNGDIRWSSLKNGSDKIIGEIPLRDNYPTGSDGCQSGNSEENRTEYP
ncbi:MAG: hypothetical protein JWM04_437 [Verrucomicrobiales bacterium]|nr:hypothetical protein [Verrucomicrobiales bacterium]